MRKFKILTILVILIIIASMGYAKPRVTVGKTPYQVMSPDALVIQRISLNANNIAAFFENKGIFDQDTRTTNTPGFEWPKGSNKHAIFTAGLCLAVYINGQMGQVMASYEGEWRPGTIINHTWTDNPDFKMYTVRLGDNSSTNPDYANWYKMVPYGAPWVDVDGDGQYTQDVDIPGRKNAGQTIFVCLVDADASLRTAGEGFGGGVTTPLLMAELQLTSWAYTTPGLEDMQFVNFVIINKGLDTWDSVHMGVVVDPDLGQADDDYIGCDTTQNMGFCYNGDNDDQKYGIAPPASGMDYFKSPIIKHPTNPALNDTLGLTSFVFFTNTGSNPPPCESDPNGEPVNAYNMLRGLKKDRTPFMDPTQTPFKRTLFVYPGDPETNTGWTEAKGSFQNCNGDTTSPPAPTPLTVNPTGDRRFIFNSGRGDWSWPPGDAQNIVLAQFVARGSSNLNSATRVKGLSKTAQIIYDRDFNVTPPPPAPVVSTSFDPGLSGLCKITLSWGDISESYRYWDSIFYLPVDSNIYYFQGYEVYEINKFTNQIPDFTKPTTMDPNALKLIAAYDKKDNIGIIIDTFSTGIVVNNNEQFSPFPIVPPYLMNVPAGFPNTGITRSITLTQTGFSENYGGQSSFVYGQEYQFAVVAYAVSTSPNIRRGFKVIRNSVGTQLIKIRPLAPPAGTVFTLKNNDTLNTNFKDLGVCPTIRNMNLLQNATYRVIFNPDTTYNILRLRQNQTVWDTLYKNQYPNEKTSADDSSKTTNGVYFNVQKVRYTVTGSGTNINYLGNVGLIKDPTLPTDSIQTRSYGYGFSNPNNRFITGSYWVRNAAQPWQSRSMAASFPTRTTFTGFASGLTADKLRKVTIQWTDPNNGQYAYYYRDTSLATDNFYIYQKAVMVPFKVFADSVTPDLTVVRRQVNCAFVESADRSGQFTGQWNPSTDSLGNKLLLYVFYSNYDTNITTPYKNRNLVILQSQFDIMYAWSPRLVSAGGAGNPGEELYFYPYNVFRPYYNGTVPLFYDFTTVAPIFGDPGLAKTLNAMDRIKVVPNPYYGFSTLDRSSIDKFVTFTNLPLTCKIKIYTLNGDLIKTIDKQGTGDPTFSSTAEWNLQNQDRTPVASGVYVALIDAPGIGQKVIKIVIFTSQERLNF